MLMLKEMLLTDILVMKSSVKNLTAQNVISTKEKSHWFNQLQINEMSRRLDMTCRMDDYFLPFHKERNII